MQVEHHVLKYYTIPGAPTTGTSSVQTLTIGANVTAGTFQLQSNGFVTAPITFSTTAATTASNIQEALQAMTIIGTGNVQVTGGGAGGVGTYTITFVSGMANRAVKQLQPAGNQLTGGADTSLTTAVTTVGVDATMYGTPRGSLFIRSDTGDYYVNAGTPSAPVIKQVTMA